MQRFQQVAPGILRGGAPSYQDLVVLRDVWNVKRIISLDAGVGQKIKQYCKSLGIEHIVIPLEDSESARTGLRYIKQNIRNLLTGNPAVFIHCYHGKDRTGAVIAMWRVHSGWTCDAAMREARGLGFGTGLSENMKRMYIAAICGDDFNSTDDIVTKVRQDHDRGEELSPTDSRTYFSPITPVQELLSDPVEAYQFKIANASLDCNICGYGIIENIEKFDPTKPCPECGEILLKNNSEERRNNRKLRKQILIDLNEAMAQVGVYENCNPILRGLGPIEPCGILPCGNTFL